MNNNKNSTKTVFLIQGCGLSAIGETSSAFFITYVYEAVTVNTAKPVAFIHHVYQLIY